MPEVQKLFDDPVVRALLWCLLEDGELNEKVLGECGFNNIEVRAILADRNGKLRHMRLRHKMAARFNPAKLASLLRDRLAHHLENAQKSAELAVLLRCMKQLPDWIFEEWRKSGEDVDGLLKMAGDSAA